MAIFEKYPAASWKVGSSAQLYFPVCKCTEEGENRLVERERPYRDGAKLDDTGSKARRWNVEVLFDNTLNEEGLSLNGKALYPDVLNDLIRSFDEHEAGDLVLPPIGKVRARAKKYTRSEEPETFDAARVTFTFIEDNEDTIGARNVELPGVKGSAKVLAEQTTFSADADAVHDFNISQVNALASELEGAINAPGEAVAELDQKVGAVVSAVNRVVTAFVEAIPGRGQLNDPDSSATQRKLVALQDTASRSRSQARRVRTTRILAEEDTSLYEIANRRKQSAEGVIGLNSNLDPTYVEAGTLVRVYEQ